MSAATVMPSVQLITGHYTRIGIGVKASTLGIGVEGATAVTQSSNVRVGFNIFNDTHFSKRGINYDGALNLRSLQLTYDQYLFRGFHIGPGLLAYNGTSFDASASVPGGPFTLGGTRYTAGIGCVLSPPFECLDAATDPRVQRNIQAEQLKLNSDLDPFKYYPVLSVGISWKF